MKRKSRGNFLDWVVCTLKLNSASSRQRPCKSKCTDIVIDTVSLFRVFSWLYEMRFWWKFSISTGQVVYTVAVVLCDRLWCQWLGWWPRRRTEQTVHVNCYWWVTTPPCMRHQNFTNAKAWFFSSLFPGSAEGFSLADKAINSATKSGRYVCFSNV